MSSSPLYFREIKCLVFPHYLDMLWLCLLFFFYFWGWVVPYSSHWDFSFLTCCLNQSHSDALILKFPLARQFSPNYDPSLSSLVLMTWVVQTVSFWLRFLSVPITYKILPELRIYFLLNAHSPSFILSPGFLEPFYLLFVNLPDETILLLMCHICHSAIQNTPMGPT